MKTFKTYVILLVAPLLSACALHSEGMEEKVLPLSCEIGDILSHQQLQSLRRLKDVSYIDFHHSDYRQLGEIRSSKIAKAVMSDVDQERHVFLIFDNAEDVEVCLVVQKNGKGGRVIQKIR